MVIQDIMITDVVTTTPDASIKSALQLMKEKKIRHLPVINDDLEIVGLISDRDIKEASPSVFDCDNNDYLNNPVEKIMVTNVLTALPSDFVEDAANTMTENQISCLPIEENGKLVGIITETDLLHTLVKLTGADMPSSRIDVEVPDESGVLSCISCIIKDHRLNIHSALVYPSKNSNKKVLVFRVQSMDVRNVVSAIKKAGYNVLWPKDLEMKL